MQGRVLVIAGSDSCGGAGIQADIKTITSLGSYAATAITALTAQNTEGVFAIYEIPPSFIIKQIELVLSDIGADIIKTGMLQNVQIVEKITALLQQYAAEIPIVVDPVMIAKGGKKLLQDNAIDSLKKLISISHIVTPNIPEAEILSGQKISNVSEMETAAQIILKRLKPRAVMLKGGHLTGDIVYDILVTLEKSQTFKNNRIDTKHTHGTGCTLASAIATGLAQGLSLEKAVENARNYVLNAISTAPGLGKGRGPLNHHIDIDGFSRKLC